MTATLLTILFSFRRAFQYLDACDHHRSEGERPSDSLSGCRLQEDFRVGDIDDADVVHVVSAIDKEGDNLGRESAGGRTRSCGPSWICCIGHPCKYIKQKNTCVHV